MRIGTFVAGVAAGLAISYFYRDLVKGAVVLGSKLREAQEKVASDIEDQVAEARAELDKKAAR
jgi:hypothetical protein